MVRLVAFIRLGFKRRGSGTGLSLVCIFIISRNCSSAPAASAENVAAASTSPTISSRPSSVPTTFISHVIPSSSSVSVTTQVASPSASAPTSAARSEVLWGVGTRYGGGCTEEDCWQKGACSFVDYELPAGIDGSTCVSDDIWDSGANCGGCISVTYKGKTLTIMVC